MSAYKDVRISIVKQKKLKKILALSVFTVISCTLNVNVLLINAESPLKLISLINVDPLDLSLAHDEITFYFLFFSFKFHRNERASEIKL
jgi:hypothetical protein